MRSAIRSAVLLALLLVTVPGFARTLTIGGHAFAETDFIDARAQPSLDGMPTVLLTFTDAATLRFTTVTKAFLNKPLPILLDGKALTTPVVVEPLHSNVIEISGVGTLAEAIALAKKISGRDPVPDSLEE